MITQMSRRISFFLLINKVGIIGVVSVGISILAAALKRRVYGNE